MPCSAVVVLKDVFTPVVVLLMPGFRPVAVQDGGLDAAGSGAAGRPSRGPRAVGSGVAGRPSLVPYAAGCGGSVEACPGARLPGPSGSMPWRGAAGSVAARGARRPASAGSWAAGAAEDKKSIVAGEVEDLQTRQGRRVDPPSKMSGRHVDGH